MPRKPTIKRDYSKYEARDAREISKRAVERARATKCLKPHELLYYWANGVFIGGLQPDPDQQIAAAIAAAPYYAPKLANIELKAEHHVKAVIGAVPLTAGEWAAKYLPGQSTHLLHENNNTGSLAIEDTSAITLDNGSLAVVEGAPPMVEARETPAKNTSNQSDNAETLDPAADEKKTESETV